MFTLNYNIKKINANGLELYAVNYKSSLDIGGAVFSTLKQALEFLTTDFNDYYSIFNHDASFDYSYMFISSDYKYYSMLRDRSIGCNFKTAKNPF